MNSLYNDCIFENHLPIILAGLGGFMMISFFGTVRFGNKLSIVVFLFFPVLMIDSLIVCSAVILVGALVYTKSFKFYQDIKRSSKPERRKKEWMQIRTIHPYGIRFGPLFAVRTIHLFHFYLFCTNLAISALTLVPD